MQAVARPTFSQVIHAEATRQRWWRKRRADEYIAKSHRGPAIDGERKCEGRADCEKPGKLPPGSAEDSHGCGREGGEASGRSSRAIARAERDAADEREELGRIEVIKGRAYD